MRINKNRPLEPLCGDNRGIVRMRLGRIHVMTRALQAARECRPPGGLRHVPVALRRGWAMCVLETLAEYRGTYIGVTSGKLGATVSVGAFD